ncbi:MAG: response regulator [Candidatus Omnitrophica bacterium]|nr:response regulator [Candidatus Omnitrophota bacterium]
MAHRLLVVDDDRDITENLSKKLLEEGYDVDMAFDGEEALAKLKEADSDIILLDLMLPKMNGFDVLREIRQNFNDRWRPVIIISAKTDLESFKKGYAFEADHYLTKPCTMGQVLQGIETMISLIPLRINHNK